MDGCFVTGTDTDVGKTWVSAGLMRALRGNGLRVVPMKPVGSGCEQTAGGPRNEDALRLMSESSIDVDYETVNPYAFLPAVAPHIAAAEAGVPIDSERIRRLACRLGDQGYLVVEGVGGWEVPLDKEHGVSDLAAALGLPVVLVVGLRLGCLNHALLTAHAIERRGLPLAGWVGNAVDPAFDRADANIATLSATLNAPLLGLVPHLGSFDSAAVADHLDIGPLLGA